MTANSQVNFVYLKEPLFSPPCLAADQYCLVEGGLHSDTYIIAHF